LYFEALPKTSTGKIQKHVLARAWAPRGGPLDDGRRRPGPPATMGSPAARREGLLGPTEDPAPLRRPNRAAAERPGRADSDHRWRAGLFDQRGYAQRVDGAESRPRAGMAKPTCTTYFRAKDEIPPRHPRDLHRPCLAERQDERIRLGLAPGPTCCSAAMTDIFGLDGKPNRGHVRVFFEHHRELPTRPARRSGSNGTATSSSIHERHDRRHPHPGCFRPVIPTTATLGRPSASCNWAYQWWRPGRRRGSPRTRAQKMWDLVIRGLTAPGDSSTTATALNFSDNEDRGARCHPNSYLAPRPGGGTATPSMRGSPGPPEVPGVDVAALAPDTCLTSWRTFDPAGELGAPACSQAAGPN